MAFMRRITGSCLLAALLLWTTVLESAAQPDFPALSGRVVDAAGLLSPQQRISLSQKLADLESGTTSQLVVVTLKSLAGYDIADYGYQLGRHWAVGQNDKNNGAILIVAPDERKVRIEVGYGLEDTLTDALSRIIIETAILPHFRAGDMAAGIVAGVDDIIKVLAGDAQEIESRALDAPLDDDSWLIAVFVLFVMILIVMPIILRIADPSAVPGRRGSRRSSSSSSSGGWSSRSGGGFSGGGGSFGGGGSSGSW